jgi:hypothetical protein
MANDYRFAALPRLAGNHRRVERRRWDERRLRVERYHRSGERHHH